MIMPQFLLVLLLLLPSAGVAISTKAAASTTKAATSESPIVSAFTTTTDAPDVSTSKHACSTDEDCCNAFACTHKECFNQATDKVGLNRDAAKCTDDASAPGPDGGTSQPLKPTEATPTLAPGPTPAQPMQTAGTEPTAKPTERAAQLPATTRAATPADEHSVSLVDGSAVQKLVKEGALSNDELKERLRDTKKPFLVDALELLDIKVPDDGTEKKAAVIKALLDEHGKYTTVTTTRSRATTLSQGTTPPATTPTTKPASNGGMSTGLAAVLVAAAVMVLVLVIVAVRSCRHRRVPSSLKSKTSTLLETYDMDPLDNDGSVA